MDNLIDIRDLSVKYNDKFAVKDFNLSISNGQWWAFLGLNGTGKSSVVNAIGRNISYKGEILYLCNDVHNYKSIDYAGIVGILHQINHVGFNFTCRQVIEMGLYRFSKNFTNTETKYKNMVDNVVEECGLTHIENKGIKEVSGGERQRVFLAQVLAQNPQVLILDEPTNNLDIIFQFEILDIIDKWLQGKFYKDSSFINKNRSIVCVMHDISLALKYSTNICMFTKDLSIITGSKSSVLLKKNFKEVYGDNFNKYVDDNLESYKVLKNELC